MKILYVTTISNTVNAFLIPHIELLVKQGHRVDVAFNIVQEISPTLIKMGCKIHKFNFHRSPINFKNFVEYFKLKKLLQEEKYDVIHTHTPIASALVRLACRKHANVKVMYTAHGFHFFKGAPVKNWLLYYPIEKWLSRYTDVLITINREDYHMAKREFKVAGRVEYISGVGFDTRKMVEVKVDKKAKRREIGVPENAFVVLSVGELNENKNHETIIKAVASLKNPDTYYIVCGEGHLNNYLSKLSRELGIENQVKLLGFRKDIAEICKVADVFAFPSKREGLGLAALEAMASGLPLITSNIHGIVDYSVDGVTGYTCSPTDVYGFAKAIDRLSNNTDQRNNIGLNNIAIAKKFDIDYVKEELWKIYEPILQCTED